MLLSSESKLLLMVLSDSGQTAGIVSEGVTLKSLTDWTGYRDK